jgi:hypothetical protein
LHRDLVSGAAHPVLPGKSTNMALTDLKYTIVYNLVLGDISFVKAVVPIWRSPGFLSGGPNYARNEGQFLSVGVSNRLPNNIEAPLHRPPLSAFLQGNPWTRPSPERNLGPDTPYS